MKIISNGFLLKLGSVAAIATPIAVVVACGDDKKTESQTNQTTGTETAISRTETAFEKSIHGSVLGTTLRSMIDVTYKMMEYGTSKDLKLVPEIKTELGLDPLKTKIQSNILNTQTEVIKGRNVIGVLKTTGYDFHGMTRVMLLLDGAKAPSGTTKQWGGSTLHAVYGANIADSHFATGKTAADVGGYVSFIINSTTHQIVRLSTGTRITGTTQDFADSNDIWMWDLTGTRQATSADHLQEDVLGRSIYGGIAWKDGSPDKAIINAGLGGKPVTNFAAYTSTQYAGLFVKNSTNLV